jgi:hypothetical protein
LNGPARSRVGGLALTALTALLAGCAATPSPAVRPARPADLAAASAPAPRDPKDDWHRLLIAPWGTRLQDLPIRLQEALFFRDAAGAQGAGAVSAADATRAGECFTPRDSLPSFAGGVAVSFVLCFSNERLSLIEAARDVARASAADTLQHYCDLWQSDAERGERSAGSCNGHDGATDFTARLDLDAAEASGRLSLILTPLPGRAP